MEQILINLPAIADIKQKLEVIDSKLELIQKNKAYTNVWLSTTEAAKALGITTRTLQSYRDQAMIPYSQFGREIRYRAEDIQAFLMDHYVKSRYQKGGES